MKRLVLALTVIAVAVTAPGRRGSAQSIVSEAKIGILAHDVPIGTHHQEQGVDGNGELLFASPSFLAVLAAPRPHIGVTVNSAGKSSYAYAGLTWSLDLGSAFFATLGLGGAVHDGPNISTTAGHKGLGTRALFHESVELGWRLTPTRSIALYVDHVSNADLGPRNPGLTNAGVRFGFAF